MNKILIGTLLSAKFFTLATLTIGPVALVLWFAYEYHKLQKKTPAEPKSEKTLIRAYYRKARTA